MSHSLEQGPAMLEAVHERKSGRVVFDESGHTVWEWQLATGVFTRHVNDEQRTRLEASNLQLVEQANAERDGGHVIYANSQSTYKAATSRNGSVAARRRANESGGVLRQLLRRLVSSN